MQDQEFMKEAVRLAHKNVLENNGGPFGSVVVHKGRIIGKGYNQVTSLNDPTAHAEVQAIRQACKFLNSYQLTDCVIYTSCEPCPMCIGAIYWARPKAVYYACTKEDAANIGFDDHFIYNELSLPIEQRRLEMNQLTIEQDQLPFQAWESSKSRIEY